MIRAILFDMGGTLDGDGLHWLERFVALYEDFGVQLSRDSIRNAFDEAERKSALDETIASANLAQMIELHVKWQLADLGLNPYARQRSTTRSCSRPWSSAALSWAWSPTAAATWRSCARILVTRAFSQSSWTRGGWDFSNRIPQSFFTQPKNFEAIPDR